MQIRGKTAVGYCRISETDRKVDKVEIQEKSCRAHAKKHGYNLVQIYADDGLSAYTGITRPGFEQLLADAADGKFEVIIATFEDRLARQPKEKLKLAWACADQGIVWHTVHDGLIDPANEDDELFVYLRGAQARREISIRSKRQRERFDDQFANGLPLWGTRPFGFDKNRLDHEPSEAAELVWAYERVLGGGSVSGIARAWNERGLKTSRGNAWSYQTVQQMLLRPRNAGLMEYQGQIVYDAETKWKPIVDRETWEAVHTLLTDPSGKSKVAEAKWLCSGIAVCGVCGVVMRPSTASDRKTSFTVYRCATRAVLGVRDGRRHTAVKSLQLDDYVKDEIAAAFIYGTADMMEGAGADLAEVRRLRKRLGELKREQDAVTAMVGQRGMNSTALVKRADALADEQDQIMAQLADIARGSAHAAMLAESRTELLRGHGRRVRFADAYKLKQELIQRFDALPLEQRRTLVRSLLRITVNPGRAKLRERVDIEHRKVLHLNDWSERLEGQREGRVATSSGSNDQPQGAVRRTRRRATQGLA